MYPNQKILPFTKIFSPILKTRYINLFAVTPQALVPNNRAADNSSNSLGHKQLKFVRTYFGIAGFQEFQFCLHAACFTFYVNGSEESNKMQQAVENRLLISRTLVFIRIWYFSFRINSIPCVRGDAGIFHFGRRNLWEPSITIWIIL